MRRNSYALAALATAGIPGVIPVATSLTTAPGDDIDSALIRDTDDRLWVVTAPTGAPSGARVAKEIEVLEALARTELAPIIQSPQGFAAIPEGGRAVVALALEGAPLDVEAASASGDLASDLGRTLAMIHNTPGYATDDAGVEEFTPTAIRERHLANIARASAVHDIPAAVAQRWKLMLARDDLWAFTPRFIHGSLGDERLLTVGESVSGILAWENAAIADPAVDLAWVLSGLEPEAFDTMYTAYAAHLDVQPDPHLLERTQLVGEFAVLEWLLAGMDTNNEEIVREALDMLADVDEDLAELARQEAEHEFDDLADGDAPAAEAPAVTTASEAPGVPGASGPADPADGPDQRA